MGTVVITGANRGIGLSLAKACKARGDTVVAICRSSTPALEGLGVRVESGIDVTSDEAVRLVGERLKGIAIDLLVLNAGILRGDDLDNVDLEDVRAQLETNAIAPLRLVRALRAGLRKGSKVALITSRMGSIADNGSGGYYGYRMSKAALNAAGVSMARDLAGEGVAVAILHPGFVKTEMTGRSGNVEPDDAARMLLARVDALTLETSGTFWHANGEVLPW